MWWFNGTRNYIIHEEKEEESLRISWTREENIKKSEINAYTPVTMYKLNKLMSL